VFVDGLLGCFQFYAMSENAAGDTFARHFVHLCVGSVPM
jgi:hypothetical protein